MRIEQSVCVNNQIYEMYSEEIEFEEQGYEKIYFINAIYKNDINNNNFYFKPIDVGSNLINAIKIFNLIVNNEVYPIHIKDIILDYMY